MDKITKHLLEDFQTAEGLSSLAEADAFVRFANFSVISHEFSDTINIEDVTTDGSNDTGLDGVAIIVNGVLVTDENDVDALIQTNGYLSAHFVFVQSKTSSSFNGAEMSSFALGVKDFFEDPPKFPRNDAIAQLSKVQEKIYDSVASMSRGKPDIHLYYVTTGKWQNDAALEARLKTCIDDFKEMGLFDRIQFNAIDADRLQELYQATKSKASAEFRFAQRLTLPEMSSVSEAHLGILPAADFVKLLEDASGKIRKSLFYDNVRDFQDYNPVNKDIRSTLQSAEKERFVLLNNGVTIVAKSMRTVGDKFFIEDYQVVNGCQTSHVLFDCRENLTDSVYVPLRIIVTDDDAVMSGIITATNRQTAVKAEQLYALSDFQKKLEAYYGTFEGAKELYYERRARQFAGMSNVAKVRIVTIQLQMRVFASMFLNDAHRGHYPASLRPNVGGKIFRKDHRLEPYYTSAFAHYRLESLFRNGTIDTAYKPARFHLLMILRHQIGGTTMPNLAANQMEGYCDKICDRLWNDDEATKAFVTATKLLDEVVGGRNLDRDLAKTQQFTDDTISAL